MSLDGGHAAQVVIDRLADVEHVRRLHRRHATRPRRARPAVVVAHHEDAVGGAGGHEPREVIAGRPARSSAGRANRQVRPHAGRDERRLELPDERRVLVPLRHVDRLEVEVHPVRAPIPDGRHDGVDESSPCSRVGEEGGLGGATIPGHHRHGQHHPDAVSMGRVDDPGHGRRCPAVPARRSRRQAFHRCRPPRRSTRSSTPGRSASTGAWNRPASSTAGTRTLPCAGRSAMRRTRRLEPPVTALGWRPSSCRGERSETRCQPRRVGRPLRVSARRPHAGRASRPGCPGPRTHRASAAGPRRSAA